MSGTGTIDNPFDLATALGSSTRIYEGDTILLRGGTYTGDFTCSLNGVSDRLITIKAYPGEAPIIDGKLTLNGSYYRWENIVHRYSGWTDRIEPLPGKALDINARGCKIINCVFHDLQATGFWEDAIDAEFYGNVVMFTGWSGLDRGYAHSLYTQNNTGRKLIKHNIMHSSFGWGIHVYTESGHIDNFDIIENTCFNAGSLYGAQYDNILIGGGEPAMGIVMNGNMTYGGRNGYLDFGINGVTLSAQDNYFPDGWDIDMTTFTLNQNNTIGEAGNRVFVHANAYDAGRANVTIYNQAAANTVEVDVSAIYANGTQVQAHNVQDYFADTQTLTVTAGKITVNMQAANRTVATPIGWTAPATTFPRFGCFVLEAT